MSTQPASLAVENLPLGREQREGAREGRAGGLEGGCRMPVLWSPDPGACPGAPPVGAAPASGGSAVWSPIARLTSAPSALIASLGGSGGYSPRPSRALGARFLFLPDLGSRGRSGQAFIRPGTVPCSPDVRATQISFYTLRHVLTYRPQVFFLFCLMTSFLPGECGLTKA